MKELEYLASFQSYSGLKMPQIYLFFCSIAIAITGEAKYGGSVTPRPLKPPTLEPKPRFLAALERRLGVRSSN